MNIIDAFKQFESDHCIWYRQRRGPGALSDGGHDRRGHAGDGHHDGHHVHAPVPHHRHHGAVARHVARGALPGRRLGRAGAGAGALSATTVPPVNKSLVEPKRLTLNKCLP